MGIFIESGIKVLFILLILQAMSIWINSNNQLISEKKRIRDKRIICTISMLLSGLLIGTRVDFESDQINLENDKIAYIECE